eukprot:SAG25_NODE_14213_length_257_cov_1.000000_1_plen_34_part_01
MSWAPMLTCVWACARAGGCDGGDGSDGAVCEQLR